MEKVTLSYAIRETIGGKIQHEYISVNGRTNLDCDQQAEEYVECNYDAENKVELFRLTPVCEWPAY